MITRRNVLEAAGAGVIGSALSQMLAIEAQAAPVAGLSPGLPEGTQAEAVMETLPGKKPLIKLSYRPPNYETPISYFRKAITPNDAFFVRYHLSNIPEVDAKRWKLAIDGDGASSPMQIGLDDLKRLPAVEVTAVCQCSGNRRGLFQPHVAGVEWGYGAMGCARWKGVRLKDLLDQAGLKKEAVEIVFNGTDGPVSDKTPKFVKSLPVWKAVDESTIVAYEMNGEPLPHWNGFPARLIVPGWTGTYWVKHLASIGASTKPFDGFWMKAAYRIPLGKFPIVAHFMSQETAVNTPITEMVVNSLITSHADGAMVRLDTPLVLGGVAWDAGYGVATVEVSIDGGKTWSEATLDEDLGNFSFRPWTYRFAARTAGKVIAMARAINKIGQTQTTALIPNPAGYHHNVIHSVTLNAA
jgi:DMSO/TMAO reductase YedYZ molybdopterin-dependent catalytic subunit